MGLETSDGLPPLEERQGLAQKNSSISHFPFPVSCLPSPAKERLKMKHIGWRIGSNGGSGDDGPPGRTDM